jgi:hypothetical protein
MAAANGITRQPEHDPLVCGADDFPGACPGCLFEWQAEREAFAALGQYPPPDLLPDSLCDGRQLAWRRRRRQVRSVAALIWEQGEELRLAVRDLMTDDVVDVVLAVLEEVRR